MYYSHIDKPEDQFALPSEYAGVYGFDCLTDAQRAEYGVYPYVREDLLPGAPGWGDAYLDSETQRIVKPSLPANPEKALADAKAVAHARRYAELLNARNSGVLFNGKIVESDQESRMLIAGAVQLATLAVMQGTQGALEQFAAGLGAGWRYADGTIAATDAYGMIALGQALAARVAYCDAVSQSHKAAIDACTTVDEVRAIDVSTGYAQ